MTIDELNALTTLTATDEVPVWDAEASSEPTRKITAQNMANSVKSLASLPNTTEMNTAIAQSTAKTSGSVTPNTTYIYENSLNWSKCGNVVCIHGFFLSAPAGVPAGSQLYTLPFTPVSNGGCSIATYNGDEIRALAWDANKKAIKLQTSDISTAKWFYCAFAYIASD